MPIISKEHQIQEQLARIYESLVISQDSIKNELNENKVALYSFCGQPIQENFKCDKIPSYTKNLHQIKFIKYDVYSHIIDIINDYMDINGQFPEYNDMYSTLENIMLQLADEEKYELAGILKKWVDEIKNAIHLNGI